MMKSRLFTATAVFAFAIFPALIAVAQEKAPKKEKEDRIRLSVEHIGHADDGRLVLCVRIHAKATEDLSLFGEREKPGPNQVAGMMPFLPFSLASSYLVDTYTNEKIATSPHLPRKPYYGPMEVVMGVCRNGWLELGVSFPKPPAPPLDKYGKQQDYKLLLYTPLDAEPVLVTFPAGS